ncbi:helix-turn-helix domain-containing protein [Bacteroidota bacterium]
MVDRISLILKLKNLSSSQFADKIGVQRSSVSHVLSGRNKPSLDFISKILNSYPEISYEWILAGKGEMIKNGSVEETDLFTSIREDSKIIEKDKDLNQKESISTDISDSIKSKTNNEKPLIATDIYVNERQEESNNVSKDLPSEIIEKSEKKVARIIVLYDDRTFTYYSPEE